MSDSTLPPITTGAARIACGLLASPGWCKDDVVKAYRAGSLAKRIRKATSDSPPTVVNPKAPTVEENRAARAWLEQPVDVTLNERERELCRDVVSHFVRAAQVELIDDLISLMDAIGLKPEAV